MKIASTDLHTEGENARNYNAIKRKTKIKVKNEAIEKNMKFYRKYTEGHEK